MNSLTHPFVLGFMIVSLAACGGGGAGGGDIADTGIGGSGSGGGSSPTEFGFDTGIGGSGGAVGPVQDFGSIFVNDLVMNIDNAEFEIEGEDAGVGLVGQSQLQEGQQVVIPYDVDSFDGSAYEAVEVYYRSNIKGPLTSITVTDLATGFADLMVLGQNVRTNAATLFSGGAALETLVAGSELEVSGVPDANGLLIATFIELKSSLTEYKVIGRVTNATATTFTLDGLTVDYSATAFIASDGEEVEVKIDAGDFTAPSSARAREVEQLPDLRVDPSAEVEYEGFITSFSDTADPAVKNFVVNGLAVTTSSATDYEDGSVESLADNVKVEVSGTVDANGTLVAEKIELESTNAVRAESTVAAVDLAAGKVTTAVGLTFTISDLTELEDERDGVEPFTLDDLANGDYVEVRGFLEGSVIKAVELERDEFRDEQRLRAPVSGEPTVSGSVGTLSLLDVSVTATDAVTTFADGDGTLSGFFSLVDIGTFVEARWDVFSSADEIVDELKIEDDD